MYYKIILAIIFNCIIAQATEINVNCGANDPLVTYDNIKFEKDCRYEEGNGYGYVNKSNPPRQDTIQIINIGNQLHSETLYRSSLYGIDEYKIDLPKGKYFLTLHLYEPVFQTPGKRIFSIYAEDKLLVEKLDLVKEVGSAKVLQIRKLIEVNDGVLNLTFDEIVGRSILTAIMCESAKEFDQFSTPEVSVIAGYNQNIIHFSNYDYNISYYNVYKEINKKFVKINSEMFSQTFIDSDISGDKSVYKFSSTDMLGRESKLSEVYTLTNKKVEDTKIKSYKINIDPKEATYILENKYSNDYKECVFEDNISSYNAEVRLRGKSTRVFHKKSWKIKFDDKNKYEEQEKLNFLSLVFDPSMIREKLFHDIIMETVGFDLIYEYRNIFLNEKYLGLFLTKEQEENEFLERTGIDEGAVFKAIRSNTEPLENQQQYSDVFEIQNNYEGDYSDLHSFLSYVDTASVSELDANLKDHFYVSDFLKNRAIINYLADGDQCTQNYILIYESENKKWRFVTYDNNFALFDKQLHIKAYTKEYRGPWDCYFNLFDKILKVSKYNYLYLSFVNRLINHYCNPELINTKIDSMTEYILEDAKRDPYKYSHADNKKMIDAIEWLKQYFVDRQNIVKEQLLNLDEVEIPQGISFNEIMTNNDAVETEPGKYDNWVEFYNDSDVEIDLADFELQVRQNNKEGKLNFVVNTIVAPKSVKTLTFNEYKPTNSQNLKYSINSSNLNIKLIEKKSGKLIDEIAVPNLRLNESYAELDDTSKKWMTFIKSTFGMSNLGMSKNVKLYINEYMPKNDSTFSDEQGEYDDWIELYNPNDFDVDLSGFYFSDKMEELDKWRIPDGTIITPKGFLLFWADKDEKQGSNHIDFKLSGDSGYVILTNPYKNIIIDSTYYIDADTDESFARNGDGSPEWIKTHLPTPDRSNLYYDGDTKYNLRSIYPNPTDDYINIYFALHRNKKVKIRICDYRGLTIKELFNGKYEEGEYSLTFDISEFASGTYFLYFETKDYYEVKPFIKIK